MNRSLSFPLALLGIAAMVVAMLIGPFFSPPEFFWIRHSTSEQAGQHLAGAWIMRIGFAGYGSGTLLAALNDRTTRPLVRWALVLFGAGLVGTAVWSNASILPDYPSDMGEDWLHSVASTIVGIGFAAACVGRLFGRDNARHDWLAWAGLAISIAVPLEMAQFPEGRGLLQRTMFAFSFFFVAREFRPIA